METEAESENETSDLEAGNTAVNLSKDRKARIRAQWSNALIVKVIGKTEANFNTAKANIATIVVWVRLPNLPIEYYDPLVLWDIGRAIGLVLQIDTHTATKSRERFVRLCIQISYDRPLIKLIKIRGISQTVQYEGISSLCFSCGRVGHKEESCPYKAIAAEKAGGDDANGENLEGKKSTPNDKSYPTKENFGSWVLVARKKKVNKDFRKDTTQLSLYGHLSPLKLGLS
nr:uncharacterized protein LOC111983002 [Quercus suber]POE88813.1 uncharacterized protein CFP56_25259 [Quercus suber]